MASTSSQVKRRRRPEERRTEIIQAAVRLFAQQGFERTTTREIAAEAGIAEGTIYKYFASKQDILFAFVAPVAFHSVPRFFQLHAGQDDLEVINAFTRDRLHLFEENRDLLRVILGEALFNPALAEGLHRALNPAVQALTDHIAHRVAHGAFREVDPVIAARALIGSVMMNFVFWNLLTPPETARPADALLAQQLSTIFLHGVANPEYALEDQ